MNLNDSQQYIITDINEFWFNSINPVNKDRIFNEYNYTSVKECIKLLNQPANYSVLQLFNSLQKNYYLLKGEYLVSSGGLSIITNKRFYILDKQELSIPINTITFYGIENGQLILKYLGTVGEKKYFIDNPILIPAIVNNYIEIFKSSPDLNNEVIQSIISTPKTNLAQLGMSTVPVEINEYKQPKDYKNIIALCIFLLFLGSCVYFLNKNDNSSSNSTTNTNPAYDSTTGKKKKKCPWCGGIGRVGYGGESKAQVERTGMGLGNYCTTCTGTGYVNDDDK